MSLSFCTVLVFSLMTRCMAQELLSHRLFVRGKRFAWYTECHVGHRAVHTDRNAAQSHEHLEIGVASWSLLLNSATIIFSGSGAVLVYQLQAVTCESDAKLVAESDVAESWLHAGTSSGRAGGARGTEKRALTSRTRPSRRRMATWTSPGP